jgi:hypothetical protein
MVDDNEVHELSSTCYLEFFRKVLYSCTVQKVAALLKFMCKQLPVCCIFFEKFLIVSVIFF